MSFSLRIVAHVGNCRGGTPPSYLQLFSGGIESCATSLFLAVHFFSTRVYQCSPSACVYAIGDSDFGSTEGHHHLPGWSHTLAGESVPGQRRAQLARRAGVFAKPGDHSPRNITVCPSLTAPGHIAIATGSTAAANDIIANTFHLIASPFTSNISGFAAPLGGYLVDPPAEDPTPTAEPIWVTLRHAGKKVVTATWPGADGLDIRLPPGSPSSPIIQSSSRRITDYTVPFGAFGGIGARGSASLRPISALLRPPQRTN